MTKDDRIAYSNMVAGVIIAVLFLGAVLGLAWLSGKLIALL